MRGGREVGVRGEVRGGREVEGGGEVSGGGEVRGKRGGDGGEVRVGEVGRERWEGGELGGRRAEGRRGQFTGVNTMQVANAVPPTIHILP